MTGFVALLRGINVGRGPRVPMAELRRLLEALGYGDVRTLLNSGNAVFSSAGESSAAHAAAIGKALASGLGVNVQVIVKSAEELRAIEGDNALAGAVVDPSRLLVVLTQEPAALEGVARLASLIQPPEELHVGRNAAFLHCPAGFLKSQAGEALLAGKAGKALTTRNWATVLKLLALLDASGDKPALD